MSENCKTCLHFVPSDERKPSQCAYWGYCLPLECRGCPKWKPRRDVFNEIADEYYGDRNERGTWGIVLAAHLRKNADRIREAK